MINKYPVIDGKSHYDAILKAYGYENTVGKLANFKGGYINFGYWNETVINCYPHISDELRANCSEALYKLVLDHLNIQRHDHILEIGCGTGSGCLLLARNYHPKKIIALDIAPEQIARTKQTINISNKKDSDIQYIVATDYCTTLPSHYIDKAYSVEAAQHFLSIEKFGYEMHRVLKKNGNISFAAHFSTSLESNEAMHQEDLFVKENIDNLIAIDDVIKQLFSAGFKTVKSTSIGDHVFEGYQKWILQIGDKAPPWAHNLYRCYKKNYLDYYLITAAK